MHSLFNALVVANGVVKCKQSNNNKWISQMGMKIKKECNLNVSSFRAMDIFSVKSIV